MIGNRRTRWRAALIVGLALLAGGCTGAALVMGAQASQAGVSLYDRRGGFDAWHLAPYDEVLAALLRAAATLGLEVAAHESDDEHEARFEFLTLRGDEVEVEVVCQGDSITVTRFDVGWFGPEGLGRLLFKVLVHELDQAGVYPELLDHQDLPAVSTR